MSEEVFEQPGLDPHDGLHAPDLAPLRVAAQREELAEAEARLADGLGHPLPPGDPHGACFRFPAHTTLTGRAGSRCRGPPTTCSRWTGSAAVSTKALGRP